MKNIFRFTISAALIFTFLFGSLPSVSACGPFTLSPIFSLKKHADFPLNDFLNGKTGIVPDSFGNMSLFIFYRQINDQSFTTAEKTQIALAMENQIFYRSGVNYNSESGTADESNEPNYLQAWLSARAKVSSEKPDITTDKNITSGYNYFTNCLPDAFNNATKTLEDRIGKYGNNELVKEWLKGQDTVFSNCQNVQNLPETLGENSPEWLRKDREYQIAAAQFYMSDFGEARAKFEKIAADEKSIWKNTAKFIAARTYIRQASFIPDVEDEAAKAQAEKEKNELLQKSVEKLQNILNDNSMSEYHKSAYRLLGLVKYRMIPAERLKELGDLLTRTAENQNIYNDLTDYSWLLDFASSEAHQTGSEFERVEAEKAGKEYNYNYQLKLRDLPADTRRDELTDWVFTYQAADGFQHSYEKWKETGKLDWFTAAISKTEANSDQSAELLREADKVKPDSAAFTTVRYHQIRLLSETGKQAEARQKLDEVILKSIKNLPVSTQNKFFSQRMALAENLGEFLKFAQRRAAIFDWNEGDREEGTETKDDKFLSAWENRTMFDEDAAAFLNEKVPLSTLRESALNPQLPEQLKKFLVIAVWTRAFTLENQPIEKEFTPLMLRYAKEFSPQFTKYANAANSDNREAAALLTILNYPVIQPFVPVGFGRENSPPTSIDSIRGNWWCGYDEAQNSDANYDIYGFKYPKVYPDFLSAEEKKTAEREHKQLLSSGNSSTFLARRAVEFANKNPKHPQTPEILHLAVRSTRYGCSDDDTKTFSKQAFDILHKRYPGSPWTKKTPYWFGG